MTLAELRASWQKLRAKLPDEYRVSSPESLAWHREEADASEKAGQWFGASFHLNRLIEDNPSDETLLARRARAEAELKKLPEVPVETNYEEPKITLTFPPRDPQTKSNLVDLTRFYNASLTPSWNGSGIINLDSLSSGVQTFGGIEFDVRGIIQLYAEATALGRRYPKQVHEIPVRLTCQRLHFLHATGWTVADEIEVGKYVIHFADGQKRAMPIVYGLDVRDWWAPKNAPPETKRAVVAWQGTNGVPEATSYIGRLFKSTWENPRPGVEVKRIDYVSSLTVCAPFLIAITAE